MQRDDDDEPRKRRSNFGTKKHRVVGRSKRSWWWHRKARTRPKPNLKNSYYFNNFICLLIICFLFSPYSRARARSREAADAKIHGRETGLLCLCECFEEVGVGACWVLLARLSLRWELQVALLPSESDERDAFFWNWSLEVKKLGLERILMFWYCLNRKKNVFNHFFFSNI